MRKSVEIVSSRLALGGWSLSGISRCLSTVSKEAVQDSVLSVSSVKTHHVPHYLMNENNNTSASDLFPGEYLSPLLFKEVHFQSRYFGILQELSKHLPFDCEWPRDQENDADPSPLLAGGRVIRSTKMRRKKMMNKHKHRKRLKKNRNKTKR